MPRRPRTIHTDAPHHITQRGHAQQPIFDTNDDRRLFLRLLDKYATRYELEIWGYCLLPARFHLIAMPRHAGSIAGALRQIQADYARYLNLRRGANGHLWHSRFASVPMTSAHVWRALAYVERTPVHAGLAEQPELFPWSSAPVHYGLQSPPPWLTLTAWRGHCTPAQWRKVLRDPKDDSAFAELLRSATAAGRPMDDPSPSRGRRSRAAATAA